MKNLLKVVICLAVVIFSFSSAKAQIRVGGGLWYGTDINNIGISLNGEYELNEKWAVAPAFTYFLKKDYVTWSTLGLNANYNITEIENVGSLYGIGGLGFTFWGFDAKDTGLGEWAEYVGESLDTNTIEFGVNIGAGLDIGISDKVIVAPELMYTFGGVNYLRIGAKIMFGL
jgi:opacity protein-like surface antigen